MSVDSEIIVVLPRSVERHLFERKPHSQKTGPSIWPECLAVFRPEEGHIRLDINRPNYHLITTGASPNIKCTVAVSYGNGVPAIESVSKLDANQLFLLLSINLESPQSVNAHLLAPGINASSPKLSRCTVVSFDDQKGVFDRIEPVIDLPVLQRSKVAIIGLGTGGGVAAMALAKSGVGSLVLVDYDRLELPNVTRHICGTSDIGRWKTRAIQDRILGHGLDTSIECFEADITEQPDLLNQIVGSVDLVLVATDSELSKYMINETCIYHQIPATYGGVYERAFAGEIVLVIPDKGGCYACVRHHLANTAGSISNSFEDNYGENPDMLHEPGLGLDVSFIANLQTKISLSVLLDYQSSVFPDPEDQMLIWVNSANPQDGPLFSSPLSRYFVKVPKVLGCRTCGVIESTENPESATNG